MLLSRIPHPRRTPLPECSILIIDRVCFVREACTESDISTGDETR
jgi:hypothetical protein